MEILSLDAELLAGLQSLAEAGWESVKQHHLSAHLYAPLAYFEETSVLFQVLRASKNIANGVPASEAPDGRATSRMIAIIGALHRLYFEGGREIGSSTKRWEVSL